MTDLFISYASGDVDRAAALHARLVKAGFTVWFDRARLDPGCDWHREIEAACEAARVMLPLVTPRWKQSEWARYETYAHAAVVPVLAEGDPADTLTPPLRRLDAIGLDPLTAGEPQWQALIAAIRGKLAEPVPEQEPRIVDLPYPANPFFTGRENDLLRLHEELHTAPVAALTQGRVRALAAMGGIGKTTLANEYARRYWRLYPQILWVDARLGYQAEFARLFDRLFPARKDVDLKPAEKARQALAELNGRAERLLVIDNVLDAESVRLWLPRHASSGCRTLITSRFADWPQAAGVRAIQLYVLEPEPARTFLVNRTGRTIEGGELTACDALARALGYLPLALEQAAAYIAAPGAGVSFAGYLRLFNAAMADLLGRGALGSTDYPDPVIATWQTTVAKLSPESRAVLRLCAWLAETAIPSILVTEGASEVLYLAAAFGPVAPVADNAVERMRDALAGLARYSMILDTTDDRFRVHGLVQAVERMQAAKDGRDNEASDRALMRLASAFPLSAYNDLPSWPLCRQLMPHQQALLDHHRPVQASGPLVTLLDRAASFLVGAGDAAAALPLFRCIFDARERVLGNEHPDMLHSANNLAFCLLELRDAAAALPLFRRALEARERVLGQEHPDTLTSVNNLASCLHALGDAAAALPLYRRALEVREQALGKEHPSTLYSMNNLASCLQGLGDAAAALPLFRRASKNFERVRGREHPDTLRSVSTLAFCLQTLGDHAEALPLLRRSLEAYERLLGKEHPVTIESVNSLAASLKALGDNAAALPLFRRWLEGHERMLGKEDPDTLGLGRANALAFVLHGRGGAAAALPVYRRWLEAYERVLTLEQPDPIDNDRRALEARIEKMGADNPEVLRHQSNFGTSLRESGRPDLAEAYARRSAEGSTRVLGARHPNTIHRRNNLALTLLMLKRTEEARQLLAENWAVASPPRVVVSPALAFLGLVVTLLDDRPITDFVGRLKTLLLDTTLEQADGVARPWSAGYLLDWLQKDLPAERLEFLKALLATINDQTSAPALDRFALWRDAPVVALDTAWPPHTIGDSESTS